MEESESYKPEIPFPEATPSVPMEKQYKNILILVGVLGLIFGASIFGALTYLGYTNGFMTDGQCDKYTINAYKNGAYESQQLTLIDILNTTATCQETFKVNVGNQTYNLFLTECLNLNQGGNK